MRKLAALMLLLLLAGCGKEVTAREPDLVVRGDAVQARPSPDQLSRGLRITSTRIAVVTHGQASDPIWAVVKRGIEDARRKENVGVSYRAPDTFDIQVMKRMVEAAISDHPDGLIVSLPDAKVLGPAIRMAERAGIPVVTINSGGERSAEFGAIGHVGQDETIAGQGAGQRLAQDGATKVLCVIHEAGNIGLDQRCSGASKAFASNGGGGFTTTQVDINDLQGAQSTITSQLQSNPDIDAVLTLNSSIAAVAVAAAEDAGSKAKVATFDLNEDVITGIKDGSISFAVDQQQYEQGYLPIVMLKLYAENLNTVGGGQPVLTGPGIVDKDNVDAIADLAQKGTR